MNLVLSVFEALPAVIIVWAVFYLISVRRHGVRPRWWAALMHFFASAALAGAGYHWLRREEGVTLILTLGLALLCWLSCTILASHERGRATK